MKRLLTGLLFAICAVSMSAQTYYLNVYEKNGKWTSFPIVNVDSVKLSVEKAPIVGLEYVDLGLSVKWASMNLGANSPYEAGNFYAWGETQPKSSYTNETYKYYQYDETDRYYKLTKYGFHSKAGIVDYKYRLDMEDDAARVNWGSEWRMPTAEEMEELVNECQWEWVNDLRLQFVGYKVIGPNGNCIYLPIGQYKNDDYGSGSNYNDQIWTVNTSYLTNTLDPDYVGNARGIDIYYEYYYGEEYAEYNLSPEGRVFGELIRPVYSSETPDNVAPAVTNFDVKEKNITMKMGETYNIQFVMDSLTYMKPEVLVYGNGLLHYGEGKIKAQATGSFRVVVSYGEYTIELTVTVNEPEIVAEAVDLGLSVKWATNNLGAEIPSQYGYYYAWGETDPKASFGISNYKWYNDSIGGYTKYVINSDNVSYDGKTVLDLEDDAARKLWGDTWRIPSTDEFDELLENCSWELTSENGIYGYKVTSLKEGYTDKYIFLPLAGYNSSLSLGSAGYYRTSDLTQKRDDYSFVLYIGANENYYTSYWTRYNGLSIRPVQGYGAADADTVMLDTNELQLNVGQIYQMSAYGYTADGKTIAVDGLTWATSDSTVATVNNGVITAVAEGTATITATYNNKVIECSVEVFDASKPQYVDLGLSVKWATFNVGATSPSEDGDYYAWGAIDTTSTYSWEAYRFFTGYIEDEGNQIAQVSKYLNDSYYGENVDNLTVLEFADDVASVKWGGNWRTPTRAEIDELINLCEWEWTEYDGVYGYKVTSRVTGFMDRSIFLPEYCWSSSLYESNALGAYALAGQKIGAYYRRTGLTIRPVYTFDVTDIAGIMLDKSVVALALGSEVIVNASPVSVDGRAIAVNEPLNLTWSSGDPEVATVTNGKIKAVGAGKCVVTVAYGGETYEVSVTVEDPSQVAPESVDIGLSVKWATFNLGAFQPEMTGDFYSWGEAEPYYEAGNALSTSPVWKEGKDAGYTWSSYFDTDDKGKTFNKYSAESGRKVLDLADDAANLAWGGKWRIPTSAEFQELIDNCSWSYEELNGVKGYRITSKEEGYENNSIFMPIAGYRSGKALYDDEDNEGYYWSSSIDVAASSVSVMCLTDKEMYNIGKIYGFLYRPVEMYDDSEIQGLIISETKYELGIGNTLALNVQGDLDGNAISLSGTAVWSSSDDSVATVVDGVVKAVGAGVATITASYNGQEVYCSITVFDQYDVETEYVDLGLSVNWATFNLGANKPEMKGEYFAWGETSPKSVYTQDTYKFNSDSLRKYGDDGKYILDSEDDAAQVLWGGSWRMPTADEFQELIDNCSWTLTELDGVNGYLVTSKITGYSDKSIFLPITGSIRGNTEYNDEGYYWASTMNPDDETSIADYLYLDNQSYSVWRYYRYQGRTIRPVSPNQNHVDKVILTDDATVLVNETVDGEPVYKAAPRIIADPADSTNNCIIVTAPSYPENYYDAQLYITVSDSVELPAGAILELSFRYKADNSVDCATEIHSVPGKWAGEGPGYIYFSPRWQKYSISTSVMDPDQRVFVINLAYLEEGNNFYFDDIAVTIVDNMADGFILNTNTLIRTVGEYGYLYAHDNAGNELNQFTQWVSTNDSVAVVNSFGEVRAIGEGTCYILASYRDYKDSCEIIVNGSNEDPYLELKYHKLPLMVGESFYISYNTNVNDDIYWESSNRNIVSVDKEGVITAESTGSCFIIATVGNLSDSCLVIVRNEEQEYVDTLVSHDFVVKDDSVFFYCYNSNVGYEMLATFAETDSTDYMVCTGLYASVAYKTAEEAQQAYADMTSEMSEEQIQSYNFRLIDDEGIYGITYNYPTVIGMDRDAVLAMMYQSYNSMIGGPEGQQEGPGEYEEPGYIGKVQAFLPAEYADSNAVAAWYQWVDEQENSVKYEAVFLFEDGSLVVTKSKFYTKADGRNPELEILATGQYELTDGDFDNGIASVILSDGSEMDVEIDGGVLYAMYEAFVKQKNNMLPEPAFTH
ncbi:MAG: Ig-like domain-containing protein [Bacteroidaceae bacterium]|nr:Ig-like domain-containing protein [Bacteroidaceae bacterium]